MPGVRALARADISPRLAEKVHVLLEQRRVFVVTPRAGEPFRFAYVSGEGGVYLVRASERGVACDCQAGRAGAWCSHALAAMCVWGESGAVESGPVEG
jgi:hypothetical protein